MRTDNGSWRTAKTRKFIYFPRHSIKMGQENQKAKITRRVALSWVPFNKLSCFEVKIIPFILLDVGSRSDDLDPLDNEEIGSHAKVEMDAWNYPKRRKNH